MAALVVSNCAEYLMITPSATPPPAGPIFVTGVWRSGTSLLVSLMNQHPQVALMYECSVLDFPAALERLRMKGNWLGRQEFFNNALSRHRLTYAGSLRGLETVRTPEDLYRTFAEQHGASQWGEKAPTYARRLKALLQRHPQASVIVIWRSLGEIMRSVRDAGRHARYFRRPGMLARVLGLYERMATDTAWLQKNGCRILDVEYGGLVDDTERTMRRVCSFLGVEFDARMTTLKAADFSPLFSVLNHDHLLNGVVARRDGNPELPSGLSAKLARFESRALRLRGIPGSHGREPGIVELVAQRVASGFWFAWDGLIRILFEFLPLAWLQAYRSLKAAFVERRKIRARRPLPHTAGTVITVAAFLLLTWLNFWLKVAHPNLMILPLAMLNCSLLTLSLGTGWGLVAATFTAIVAPIAEWFGDMDYANLGTFAWNFLMRFVVLSAFVFLLDAVLANVATRKEER